MTILLKLAVIGGILLALASAYPGVLVDLIFIGFILSPLWFPAMIFGGLVVLCFMNRPAKEKQVGPDLRTDDEVGVPKRDATRKRWIVVSPAILALSFALILTGIPMRVGFLLSLPAFERVIISERPAIGFEGESVGRLFGVYHVHRHAADSRGGTFFRTYAGADGIGPDTMSYGFAYRPNPKGTPFGNAHYGLMHLVGDWYCFSASNDY